MGWFASAVAGFIILMAGVVGAWAGLLFAVLALFLILPPIWKPMVDSGRRTRPTLRWSGALAAGFLGLGLVGGTYSKTPDGRAAQARRDAADKQKADKMLAEQHKRDEAKREMIASGEHCLSGWDGSLPELKTAVKAQLRNPASFEHDNTVRTPVDKKGTFGLIMTYRAENGFGGTNVEAIGVEVDAQTCNFKRVSNTSLARRLRSIGQASTAN